LKEGTANNNWKNIDYTSIAWSNISDFNIGEADNKSKFHMRTR